jgi:hypothetical protein
MVTSPEYALGQRCPGVPCYGQRRENRSIVSVSTLMGHRSSFQFWCPCSWFIVQQLEILTVTSFSHFSFNCWWILRLIGCYSICFSWTPRNGQVINFLASIFFLVTCPSSYRKTNDNLKIQEWKLLFGIWRVTNLLINVFLHLLAHKCLISIVLEGPTINSRGTLILHVLQRRPQRFYFWFYRMMLPPLEIQKFSGSIYFLGSCHREFISHYIRIP